MSYQTIIDKFDFGENITKEELDLMKYKTIKHCSKGDICLINSRYFLVDKDIKEIFLKDVSLVKSNTKGYFDIDDNFICLE